ncbi:MAG: CHAT domain-containing protein [Ferruginibacter sp.]
MAKNHKAQQEWLLNALAASRTPQEVIQLLFEKSELVDPGFLALFEDSNLNPKTAWLIGNESKMQFLHEKVREQYISNLVTLLFGMSSEKARLFIREQITDFLLEPAFTCFQKLKKKFAAEADRTKLILERIQFVIEEGIILLLTTPRNAEQIIWSGKSWFTYAPLIQTLHLWKMHPDNTNRINWLLDRIAGTTNAFIVTAIESPQVRGLYTEYLQAGNAAEQVRWLVETSKAAAGETEWVKANIEWLIAGHLLETSMAKQAETLENVMEIYERVLHYFNPENFLYRWAGIQNGLGRCYAQYQKDDPLRNIRKAIVHFEAALEAFEKTAAPYDWALACNNLGSCYLELHDEDKPANREKAKKYFNLALTVQHKQWTPDDWAMTQMNLGLAFSIQDIDGDVKKAIEHFNLACSAWTRAGSPVKWAEMQTKIAIALHKEKGVDRVEAIEHALEHLTDALSVLNLRDTPVNWAEAIYMQGILYQDRIQGERIANIEQSISCLEKVLQVYTSQSFPYNAAHTHLSLARAYWRRLRGEPGSNSEKALAHIDKALGFFDRHRLPVDWATAKHLQGILLDAKMNGEKLLNYKNSEEALRCALTVRKAEKDLGSWAETMNSLGNVLRKQGKIGVKDAADNAVECFKSLLAAINQAVTPRLWAVIHYNAGIAFEEAPEPQVNAAIDCFKKALTIHTPVTDPEECFKTAIHLGRQLYKCGQIKEASEVLIYCHEAIEYMRTQSVREQSRKQLGAESAEAYQLLVHCFLLLHDKDKAYYYTSAAKARVAADQAADTSTAIEKLRKNTDFSNKWQRVALLREQLNIQTDTAKRTQQQTDLSQLLDDLFFEFPGLGADEAMKVPSTKEILTVLTGNNNIPLLDYYRHAGGWCLFVLFGNSIQPIELSNVSDQDLLAIDQALVKYEQQVVSGIDPQELNEDHLNVLANTWNLLLKDAKSLLPAGGPLLIAPAQSLHLIPLHIAFESNEGRYLCDYFDVCYIQGAAVLKALHQYRLTGKIVNLQEQNILSVAFSARNSSRPLYHALSEAQAVAGFYADQPTSVYLHEQQATVANVMNVCAAQPFHTLHFCSHGNFQVNQPDQSGLLLAEGILTTEHIRTELRLLQPSLILLSACETGLSRPEEGDEAVGLIQSFLAAGAGAVISSMWSVEDNATRELFTAFLNALKNMPVHRALHFAMRQLRSQDRWQFPVYWGAFKYTGLPSA